jgi:hypothetical protein
MMMMMMTMTTVLQHGWQQYVSGLMSKNGFKQILTKAS